MTQPRAEPFASQRNAILALLITLAAASWALLYWQASNMDMSMTMRATMGLTAPLFLAVWIVMMAAMMFPAVAPMVLAFHQVQTARRKQGLAFVSTWIFVGGYMAVWTAAGLVAYGAALAGERLADLAQWSPSTAARSGGLMLILAGVFQLTPLKAVCLSKCRTPMGFIVTSWRDGAGGALRMGLVHGLYCLGCCWLLFVILFPLGMMNIAATALLAVLIFAEKTLPWGQRAAMLAAALFIAYGVMVLFSPVLLPTFMDM